MADSLISPQSVVKTVLMWEGVSRTAKFAFKKLVQHPGFLVNGSDGKDLLLMGPAYTVSLVHALINSVRGVAHIYVLLQGPLEAQLIMETNSSYPWSVTSDTNLSITLTNTIFISYLIQDVTHILLSYPDKGGADVTAHHLGFMGTSLLCSIYRILPLPFGWLMAGELSTIPLNVRWLLILTGRGETRALQVVQIIFAALFVLTRILGYGLGLVHLWIHRELIFSAIDVPTWAASLVLLMVVAGYGLNLMWLQKIVSLATRKPRAKKRA